MSPEKLAEIDRELDAFGKSDEALRALVARARSWIASIDDLDRDLAALGEAVEVAKGAFEEEPSTAVLRAPSEPPRSSDIAGLSVDELFADAEPSAAPSVAPEASGLADLFEDEPELRSESPAGPGLADLFEDELEGAEAAKPPASSSESLADLFEDERPAPADDLADLFADEPGGADLGHVAEPAKPVESVPPPWSAASAELSPFSDEDDEVTTNFTLDQVAKMEAEAKREPTDEFELLVDEEVLELDEELEPSEGEQPGLISRILGRK